MSAVIKKNHIETIYDHGVTEKEKTILFGDKEDWQSQKEYYDLHRDANDSLNADLYRLFISRNDSDKASYYLSLIENANYRRCVAQPHCIH